jgi:hypothetical protein
VSSLRRRWALAVAGALGLTSSLALGQTSPALTVPPAVMAENSDRSFPGVWETIEAGAVLSRVGDPSAVWYNPAGIVRSDRSAINANAPGYEFTAFGGSGFDRQVQGSTLRGLPSFVGAILGREVLPWRDLRLGFGLTNPVSWRQGLSLAAAPSPAMRSSYSVNSELESFEGTVALAYSPLAHLRLGLSLGFSWDTISSAGQIAAEKTTAAVWQGAVSSSIISANTQQFVSSIGMQYDITPWLGVGGVLRTPSMRILGTAGITYNSLATTTTDTQQLYFQDSSARFELRQPLQICAGATARTGPLEFEMDVSWHQASGAYDLFSSSQPVRLVTTPAGGGPPVVTTNPYPTIRTQTRAILNTSIGGNLSLGDVWTLHSGIYINQAPTYPSDPFFLPINFYGLRVGTSIQGKNLVGSVGLGYEVGSSQRAVGIGTLPGAPPPETGGRLTIHTISVLIAIGYRF